MDRIKKLRGKLKEKGLDAILISSTPNIFYLSGIDFFIPIERDGYLLITKTNQYVLTSSLYKEAVAKNVKNFTLLETSVDQAMSDNLKKVKDEEKLRKVGFEEGNLTVTEYSYFKKIFPLSPAEKIVDEMRIFKDHSEVEKIKKACKIGDEAFSYIQKQIKLGVTEKTIQNLLEEFFKKSGASSSFDPIVAFGAHSSIPHHNAGESKLTKSQIVLLDFGVKFEGYSSDMTRTLFFGKAPRRFKNIYQTTLDSQTKAFEYLKKNPKAKLSDVDKAARDYIFTKGFSTIPHSLGHQIGIEVHDKGSRLSPSSKEKVENGMVFSIEPGIYIPGFGGVRIEDLVHFENGPKFITYSKRELIEL